MTESFKRFKFFISFSPSLKFSKDLSALSFSMVLKKSLSACAKSSVAA